MTEGDSECLKNKRVVVVGIVILALVIGLTIGLVAGLRLKSSTSSKVSYKDVMVLRAKYRNSKEKELVGSLNDSSKNIKVFSFSFVNETNIEIPRNQLNFVQNQLERQQIDYYILVEDMQSLIDQVDDDISLRKFEHNSSNFDVANFNPYEEIVKFLHDLAEGNSLVEVHHLGLTYENRDILMAAVSTKHSLRKPIIFLDCLIHANEWITASTCLWILNHLSTKYGKDPDVTKLLDSFDWFIKPVANPDGYVYSWTTDRLWRKNRVPNQGSSCVGVDLNRNFDIAFKDNSTINANAVDPCAPSFKSYAAFSQRESIAIRDVLLKYKDRIKMALFVHSHGQLWMSPFAVNDTVPAHYDRMDRLMLKAAAAIEAVYGTKYVTGRLASVLYSASSTSIDYSYATLGIIHSYALELPDQGKFGFIAPVSKIMHIATETWNGIKEAAYTLLEELNNN